MMNNRAASKSGSSGRTRQRGAYTLLISVILLSASMTAIVSGVRTSTTDARITGNDMQGREVLHAAEAALDYGVSWYNMSEPTSWTTSGSQEIGSPTGTVPAITASNGDSYTSTVTYTRNATNWNYVLVTATATAATNPSVTETIRQYVGNNYLMTDPDFDVPPLSIGGCLSNVGGNPDIFPTTAGDVAVSTSATVDCLDQGNLGYNGGVEELGGFTGDLWDRMFSLSRTEMKAIADAEVAAGVANANRKVVWVTSTANYHQSWGSTTNAVILVFDAVANCPKINGGVVIYGNVFIDSECSAANGFGGTTVYGSVAVNGDINKLTANTEIHAWGTTGLAVPTNLKSGLVPKVLGTWKDF